MSPYNNNTAPKVISPSKLAHIVLHTNKFDAMNRFYKFFLNATASYENEQLSFLTYDDEHHRIALVNMPDLKDKDPRHAGLGHMAFTFDSLHDLCESYKARKALGIEPGWCVKHGPTVSMYYQDPDGNTLETQVDSFDTAEAANKFMHSAEFAQNPLGTDFEPEELCKAVDGGGSEVELRVRREIGARGSPEDFMDIMAKMATAKVGA
ncbi:hypothetical protein LTR27_010718 [Elasticomyces elasticus]|nr:hypothetical protein LTR27_010718 [Elasticomyces elasticus]